MRKTEQRAVEYLGYSEPRTSDELNLEILGLKTAVAKAKQRIAELKQSELIVFILEKENDYSQSKEK